MAFRLALVGAGRIGSFHARTIADSSEVELSAVVDPRPEAVAALGGDARHCATVAELIDAGGVDGALVAVPTLLHREVVTQLAAAGIPVLSEKPCGRTAAEARQIGQEVAAAGGFLRVAFWRRYVPELALLRERIARGELGKVATLLSTQWDERPPSAAFRDPASSGGLIVDTAVHDFDLVRWLTGSEIAAVGGFVSAVCSDPPVPGDPESAALVVRLADGATAMISVGRRHPPGEVQRLWAVGTDDAVDLPYIARSDDPAMDRAFRAQTEDFARAVGGATAERLATVDDAVAALAAAELAKEELA